MKSIELKFIRQVRICYSGGTCKIYQDCRYTFIQEIKRCCDKKDYEGVIDEIIPILEDLVNDSEVSIRVVTLNQFEYIANVSLSRDLTI